MYMYIPGEGDWSGSGQGPGEGVGAEAGGTRLVTADGTTSVADAAIRQWRSGGSRMAPRGAVGSAPRPEAGAGTDTAAIGRLAAVTLAARRCYHWCCGWLAGAVIHLDPITGPEVHSPRVQRWITDPPRRPTPLPGDQLAPRRSTKQ